MNQRIISIFLVAAGIMLGLYVMLSVLTGGGNEIGRLAIYISCGCFFTGLIVPRPSMYLLLFLAGYSDLLKRFMVLGTSLSQSDLLYVLAMAPVTLAGAVLSLFVSRLIRGTVRKPELLRFGICTMVLLMVGVSAMRGEGGMSAMRGVVDYGAFIYIFYVFPILFPERDELLKFVKIAVYIFVPVAIYGIWQRVFGLSNFEMDYLLTGLTVESRQLEDIAVRPFSTLNAASSLTVVMAACAMLSYILISAKLFGKFIGGCLICLFIAACIMTFTRAGWVVLGVSPFIVIAFRYRLTTLTGYIAAVVMALSLVYFSDWVLDNLQGWQAEISGEGDYGRSTQAFRVTTLYDRFLGFSNLKNPDNWKPFGINEATRYGDGRFEDAAFSHDLISSFIFRRGYVPAGIGALIGVAFLWRMHSKILSQPMIERKFTTVVVGSCVALLLSVAAGGYLFQFPANIFFWIMVCLSLSCFAPYKELEIIDAHE